MQRVLIAGITAIALLGWVSHARAVDGVSVTVHWTGTNANLYGGYGEIWRHDIAASKVVKHTKLYDGPARAVVISPDGTRVAFIKESGVIGVMSIDGGAVTELSSTRPEAHIDWPRGDWIYYNLGGFNEPSRSRVLRRVNAATGKDEAVVTWDHGVWRFFISANGERAAVRVDDDPPEPYGRIVSYDMVRDAGHLDPNRATDRFSCSTGLDPAGEYFMDGNSPHDGIDIKRWDDPSKTVFSFTHAEAEAWGGPPSGTQHNRNNWSVNSSDWFCVHLGFGKRGVNGANQVLYNWVAKERIVVTNNSDGSYAFDSAGDFFVGGTTPIEPTPDPPVIDSHPASVSVTEGSGASFTVKASGTDPLSYQWQRDGQDIAGATGASYALATTSLVDDGARFRCVVSNVAGTAASSEATLSVAPTPVENTAPTVNAGGDQVAKVGESVSLKGTASDDGLPDGSLNPTWVQLSGPDTAEIVSPHALETGVVFPAAGEYVLRLKVSDGELTGRDDVSVRVTVTQSLRVTRPVGGEVFLAGTHEPVEWEGSGVDHVSIEFSVDDGASWLPITTVNATSMDWGRVSWAIPDKPSTRCRVAVVAGDLRAESPQVFEIRQAADDNPTPPPPDAGPTSPADDGLGGSPDAGPAQNTLGVAGGSELVGGCSVGVGEGGSWGLVVLLALFLLFRRARPARTRALPLIALGLVSVVACGLEPGGLTGDLPRRDSGTDGARSQPDGELATALDATPDVVKAEIGASSDAVLDLVRAEDVALARDTRSLDSSREDTMPSTAWYTIDTKTRRVETDLFSYVYDVGGHPHGAGIKTWKDKRVSGGISFPAGETYVIDGCGTGAYKNINDLPRIERVTDHGKYVELAITIGDRDIRHRLFRGLAVLEIEYVNNPCNGWVAEEWKVTDDLLWVMYGMPKDYTKEEVVRLRTLSEQNCGGKVRSDCMVEAAGARWEDVQYQGHLICGAKNASGHGIGMVSRVLDSRPVSGDHWRFPKWRIGKAEWYHMKNGSKRWVFFVTGGKSELLSLGKAIVDNGGPLALVP